MRQLNLLPAAEKKIFKFTYINRLISILGAGLVLILILILISLFSLKIYLNQKITPMEQKLNLDQIEAKINKLNKKISIVKDFNINQYSNILKKIDEQTSKEIEWKNLQITQDQIQFRGHSPTREQMIELQKNLTKVFTQVSSPLSNLTKPSDLDFTFNINP